MHHLNFLFEIINVSVPLIELHIYLSAKSRVFDVVPLQKVKIEVFLIQEKVQTPVVLASPSLVHFVPHPHLARGS
jgi:hypothetical protein